MSDQAEERGGSANAVIRWTVVILAVVVAAAVLVRLLAGSWSDAGAAGFIALLLASGLALWLSGPDWQKTRGDFGRALVVSGLLGLALAWIQFEVNQRTRESDHRREGQAARIAARQSLQLTVGLQHDLTSIDLSGRDLSRFYLYRKVLTNAELNRANLSRANLNKANLSSANADHANFRGASLIEANLKEAVFEKTDLERVQMYQPGLEQAVASFERVLGHDHFEPQTVKGLREAGAKLQGIVLAGANLQHASAPWAHLFQADLDRSDLRGADLHGAVLWDTSLRGADLRTADFSDADLGHADLRGALTAQAKFAGATYDAATQWPAGFDPRRAGARPGAPELE